MTNRNKAIADYWQEPVRSRPFRFRRRDRVARWLMVTAEVLLIVPVGLLGGVIATTIWRMLT